MVASITMYKDTERTIQWLNKLPRKYSIEDVSHFISIAWEGKFLLWTEEHGLKILR